MVNVNNVGKFYAIYRLAPVIVISMIVMCIGIYLVGKPDPYKNNKSTAVVKKI